MGDGVADGVDGALGGLAEPVLELGEEGLDRVEIGGIFREEEQLGAGVSDGPPDGLALVRAEIIHDHDIAGSQGGGKDLFHINPKPFAVDGAVEEPRSLDTVAAQRGQKGHCLPPPARHFCFEPLAPWRPASERRHVGLGPGFIDKDETGGVNPALIFGPLSPPARHVGTILLAGEHGFF